MTDYTKLVAALRCGEYKPECGASDCPYWSGLGCMDGQLVTDAADAIEALNHLVDLNTERCEGLRKQLREAQENYEKHLNELEAQMPKRGEWVWKHRHHGGFKTAKGKCECRRDVYAQIDERYETDDPYCPFCGVMNDSIHLNYCPNCGANMMEAQ